jgi:iron complex outermembrane receptor protein
MAYFLRRQIPAALALALCAAPASAQKSLGDLSLEELSRIEITSVSKSAEPLSGAPASIFVITNDDIRRSGATTLPEALRLAPNLQIARQTAGQYAISARGFNNGIGNKLLVLVDGRTIYTPLFSGVFWDQQDLVLEDVERIEVISGPGATVWGANAVNGVINVISRRAADTQGGLVALGAGSKSKDGALRWGGKLDFADGHYRVYAKGTSLESARLLNGTSARDGQSDGQLGFRTDWRSGTNGFTVQGDTYDMHTESRTGANGQIRATGTNLLGRWNGKIGSTDAQLQMYYDKIIRDDPVSWSQSTDLWDLDYQQGLTAGRHKLQWGGGYRYARDFARASRVGILQVSFNPPRQDLAWSNLYLQDEIKLRENLDLTVGMKYERNDYSGTEHLPSARLAWRLAPGRMLWAAASRAVRAPARLDREFVFRAPTINFTFINGGPYFRSEVANVVEAGYRAQPSQRLTYSVTVFHADYDRLRSGQAPLLGQPAVIENRMQGQTYGMETWGSFQATRDWRLSAGLNTLRGHFTLEPGSRDPTGPNALGNDPPYQAMVRSALNVTPTQQFDVTVRRVPSLAIPFIPAYTAVDLRYGWQARKDLELAFIARNLGDQSHPEFGATEFEPSYMIRATFRF